MTQDSENPGPEQARLTTGLASTEALERSRAALEVLTQGSAALLSATPDGIYEVLESIASGFRTALDLDRVSIFELLPGSEMLYEVRCSSASTPDLAPLQRQYRTPSSIQGWMGERLWRDGLASFVSIQEFPEDAPDRQYYTDFGVKSVAVTVALAQDRRLGMVAVGTYSQEHAWTVDELCLLRLLGDLVGNALLHRQKELELRERLRLEQLLARLSAQLRAINPANAPVAAESALQCLGEYLGAECTWLWTTDCPEGPANALAYHAMPDAVAPVCAVVLDWTDLVWYREMVASGNAIVLAKLPDDLPPGAEAEGQWFEEQGVKSHLMVPLVAEGRALGFVTASCHGREAQWPTGLAEQLPIIANLFTNTLLRCRSEETMVALRADLARAQRVSVAGELSAAIAHELTQPLTAILSNAQAWLDTSPSEPVPDDLRETLEDIADDAAEAGSIIRRLRELFSRQQTQRQAVRMDWAIDEVIAILTQELRLSGTVVRFETRAIECEVWGNTTQLRQVVLNLLVNAAQATALLPDDEVREIEIVVQDADDGALAVTIADNGPGIPPEALPHVFDAFYTTRPGGMGMGLAISRSIAEAHGGAISVVSSGRGATFTLTLPLGRCETAHVD